ncbi:glycerophosphodiester phosphodiesterase, partial [Streptomyces albiflaviniger]|nr:glycerophosphodiester phosphodiesterase [Streptomyces albiflaviniger]
MQIRPAAALTGALIGMSALFLPTATAQATGRTTHHHTVTVAHRGASAYAPENTL